MPIRKLSCPCVLHTARRQALSEAIPKPWRPKISKLLDTIVFVGDLPHQAAVRDESETNPNESEHPKPPQNAADVGPSGSESYGYPSELLRTAVLPQEPSLQRTLKDEGHLYVHPHLS